MPHIHNVTDSDNKFIIDSISRTIKNASTSKTTVMQFDHNSEVFTFELPRYIEGHDMTECNRVEVHYLNIDSVTKEEKEGIYLVNDLTINADDENKLTCSWVISQNATGLAGSLNFLLRFICLTDDVIDYVWNTSIYGGIYVSKGIYNSDIVAEQYIDTIKAWENRLAVVENSIGSSGISPTIKVTAITGGNKVEITDANGTQSFDVMDGQDGQNGADGSGVSEARVLELINEQLGVVENGTY